MFILFLKHISMKIVMKIRLSQSKKRYSLSLLKHRKIFITRHIKKILVILQIFAKGFLWNLYFETIDFILEGIFNFIYWVFKTKQLVLRILCDYFRFDCFSSDFQIYLMVLFFKSPTVLAKRYFFHNEPFKTEQLLKDFRWCFWNHLIQQIHSDDVLN